MNDLTKNVLLTSIAELALYQSSVALFGVIDNRLSRVIGRTNRARNRSTFGRALSRLGLFGNERLVGGMSTGFWLEDDVNMDDGIGGSANINNQAGPPPLPPCTQRLTFNSRSALNENVSGMPHLRDGVVKVTAAYERRTNPKFRAETGSDFESPFRASRARPKQQMA